MGIAVVIANGIVGRRLYPVYQMLVPNVLVSTARFSDGRPDEGDHDR
jgi:hypothetical protein